jgi:uncharacterized membrane protein YdjX (TVP38/TMEM64 family)
MVSMTFASMHPGKEVYSVGFRFPVIRFDKRTVVHLVILGAVILGIGFLLYAMGVFHLFMDRDRLLSLIERHRAYAVFIFLGLQVIQVMVAVLPGEVTGFVGGILFGPLWGIILSTLGLALGSWIAFNLARLVGRPLVEVFANQETIRRYDYVLKHKGVFLAFLMFLVPGFPKDILCYLLGLGQMRQVDFLIISTLGRLLGTIFLTVGGSFFRDERYAALFTIIGISLGVILVGLIYREKIERWFRTVRAAGRLKSLRDRRKLREKQRVGKPTQDTKTT